MTGGRIVSEGPCGEGIPEGEYGCGLEGPEETGLMWCECGVWGVWWGLCVSAICIDHMDCVPY